MLPKAPTCPRSGSSAENVCSVQGCKSYAFSCTACPGQMCMLSHNHSTNQLKTWNKIVERVTDFMRQPPAPPQFKQMKNLVVELEALARQVSELAQAYKAKMNLLRDNCIRREDIEKILNNFRNCTYEEITGDDMCRLFRVINNQQGHSLYANHAELTIQLNTENSRIQQSIQGIKESINYYSNREVKSLIRHASSEEPKPSKPPSTQELVQTAERLLKESNVVGAIKILKDVIEQDPNCFSAYLIRGTCYLTGGDTENSVSDFDKCIELNPNAYKAYYLRGVSYITTNFYNKAISDIKKAYELSPNHHDYLYILASVYLKKNEYAQALDAITKALQQNRDNLKYLEKRAEIYEKMGKQNEAVQDRSKITMLRATNQK